MIDWKKADLTCLTVYGAACGTAQITAEKTVPQGKYWNVSVKLPNDVKIKYRRASTDDEAQDLGAIARAVAKEIRDLADKLNAAADAIMAPA